MKKQNFLKLLILPLALFSLCRADGTNDDPFADGRQWYKSPGREMKHFVKNNYISFAIAKNGQFTLGAERGSLSLENLTNMDMLFGHPNNFGIDEIGTTYTTFVIGEKRYQFHKLPYDKEPVLEGHSASITKLVDGLAITQRIELDMNPELGASNRFRISYQVSNIMNRSSDLNLRIMMDTWAGLNDGVPFRIPRYGPDQVLVGKKIIDHETTLNLGNIDFWETYETESSRLAIICFGKLIPEQGPAPDMVKLVSWKRSFRKEYEIDVATNIQVTGDSAIALYWTNHILGPGESRYFETFYGIRVYNEDGVNYPLSVDINNNPFNITITKVNQNDKRMRGSVTVGKLPAGVKLIGGSTRSKEFIIEPGREKTLIFSFLALPTAEKSFFIEMLLDEGRGEKSINCSINNHLREAPVVADPVIKESEPIIAKFYDVDKVVIENHFLIAELIGKQGEILEKIVLYDDGKHHDSEEGDDVYANAFKIRVPAGDYRIQVNLVKAGD